MTAAANDVLNLFSTDHMPGGRHNLLAVNGVTYYKGGLLADVNGTAVKVTGTSGLKIRGWCGDTTFTADTSNPALARVTCMNGQIALEVSGSAPPTIADHLKMMYAEDDRTVNRTSVGGTLSPVGRLMRLETIGGRTMAICEVGMFGTEQVDMAADYLLIADAASNANGLGASLVGIEDAGSFTAETEVEGALREIYQALKTTQAHLPIPLTSFLDADGDPLAKFTSESAPSFGFNLADSKALNIRWNNDATPGTALCNVALPQDLDDTAAISLHFLCSKSGATVGDATTLTITAFFQTAAALHDADADCGGVTGALVGNATAKTVAELSLTIAAGDVPPAPCSLTFTVTPTAGKLGTDDLMIHAAWIEYKPKLLAS